MQNIKYGFHINFCDNHQGFFAIYKENKTEKLFIACTVGLEDWIHPEEMRIYFENRQRKHLQEMFNLSNQEVEETIKKWFKDNNIKHPLNIKIHNEFKKINPTGEPGFNRFGESRLATKEEIEKEGWWSYVVNQEPIPL